MKIYTPLISWHNREPVYSVDVQQQVHSKEDGTKFYRMATCGSDKYVAIWRAYLNPEQKVVVNKPPAVKEQIDKDVSELMTSLLDQSVSEFEDVCSVEKAPERPAETNRRPDNEQPNKGVNKRLIELECVSTLNYHERAANVVKFAPTGQLLASGGDDNVVFIYEYKGENDPDNPSDKDLCNPFDEIDISIEKWRNVKTLRRHINDVVDLAWSPDEKYLITGSFDNLSYVWNLKDGSPLFELPNHSGYVQGVAWDPLNNFLATLCTDRYLRIFKMSATGKKPQQVVKLNKFKLNADDPNSKSSSMFYDDSLATISRRMCFSPHGELLACPSGIVEADDETSGEDNVDCLHLFYRKDSFKKLHCYFPTGTYTSSIRFCQKMFKLNPLIKNPYPFPYRLVFAIATKDKILVYDTQQEYPIAQISDIHYAGLSDLAWSVDGRILLATSTDGFCTFAYFAEGELGEFYEGEPYKFETTESKKATENKKGTAAATGVAAKKANKEKAAKKDEVVTKENQSAEKTKAITDFFQKKPLATKLSNSFQQVANKTNETAEKSSDDCLVIKEINRDEAASQPQSKATNGEVMIIDQPKESSKSNESSRPKESAKPPVVNKSTARRIAPTFLSKPAVKSIFSQTVNGHQSASNKNDENSKSNNNSLSLKRNISEESAGSEKKKKRIQLTTLE